MVKKFFADAVNDFKDKSINLLHIDGLHTYEAVKNDYETWKPKLAENSVIMLHDTRVADFGVWQVWEDIKKEYSNDFVFEFHHSYGLGIAVKGKKYANYLKETLKNSDELREYYNKLHSDSLQQYKIDTLQREIQQIPVQTTELQNKNAELHNKNAELHNKNVELQTEIVEVKSQVEELKDTQLNLNEENVLLKREISEQNQQLVQIQRLLEKSVQKYNALVSRKFVKIYRRLISIVGKDIPI